MMTAAICMLFAMVTASVLAGDVERSVSEPLGLPATVATVAEPTKVLGTESCVKCHAGEVSVWRATPHARTFDELHRRPEAKTIASNLGIRSIKHEGRCVSCHYTRQPDPTNGDLHVTSGISCESCHGAAQDWLDVHHDYGGEGVNRLTESPEHRRQRIAASVTAGMRNPHNLYAMAQSCYRCHTTPDEELVNRGGHSAGSLEFEFVSWSQGTVRHNFVHSDGSTNELPSRERLRVMFVAGIIADLEASLRATARATEKATYGITAAKRSARAAARLQSVAAKVDDPRLSEILAVFEGVKLTLNNLARLDRAADEIAQLGYRFAENHDGATLAPLDPFVPPPERWK